MLACVYAFVRPSAEYCGVFLRATKFDLEEKDAGTCHDFFGVPGCRPKCGRADQVSNCGSCEGNEVAGFIIFS